MPTENRAGVCPRCPRGCPLDAPGCLRGEIYARSLGSGPAPELGADFDGGPHGPHEHDPLQERSAEPHPHDHGPHGHDAPTPPHDHHPGPRGHGHGPGEDAPPPHGHGPHGPGRPGEDAPPPPPHGHGPHGHGRGSRPVPPEPEPDRDSLTGLMRRCGHCLVHRVGAPGSRERMLRLLAERGDMSQSDFVYLLELRSASVSELLGKLEAQGLITRRRSETDRRGVTISLTDAGRSSLPAAGDADAAFSTLTDAERAELKTLLQKLLSVWEEARE